MTCARWPCHKDAVPRVVSSALFWFGDMCQREKLGHREKMHGVQYFRESQRKRKYYNRGSQPSGTNAWWSGGGADIIITEIKCTINEMCLNDPETIPPSPSGEKLSSTKPVPGAKKSGQPLLQTKENGFIGAWVCDRGVLHIQDWQSCMERGRFFPSTEQSWKRIFTRGSHEHQILSLHWNLVAREQKYLQRRL